MRAQFRNLVFKFGAMRRMGGQTAAAFVQLLVLPYELSRLLSQRVVLNSELVLRHR